MVAGFKALTEAGVLGAMAADEQHDAFAERLGEAIARDELYLAWQPQVDTHGGRLTGFEALVRWRLSDGTVIPPDVFVPMAEGGEAIHRLGDWVLRTACETAAAWAHDGLTDVPVAVNLSARQLEVPGLARGVLGVLADTGLPAAHLKLELTETALFEHGEAARESLLELRGAGVRLVLDDFGTGYSSLTLLRKVPVESLKIDKHFVQAMVEDRDAAAIVHGVIAMAHALGLEVVAEGVETTEQLLFLRAYRCDHAQGYLMARPMPRADVPDFIARNAAQPTDG
ncbi:putative bifunctional diguanylate cyclase/phosphodiesterase [Azospirillum sp. ST 5-10]|uniref:putative bifunctional diguanylate cyclase/phosphodiesterase n=1 Tax=unclassified Azospirillum TaxID=2630922 RepID=UPI003F4A0F2D